MLGERINVIAPSLPRHAMLKHGEKSVRWEEVAERFAELMAVVLAVDNHGADSSDPAAPGAAHLV
jgi:hypothetical protein